MGPTWTEGAGLVDGPSPYLPASGPWAPIVSIPLIMSSQTRARLDLPPSRSDLRARFPGHLVSAAPGGQHPEGQISLGEDPLGSGSGAKDNDEGGGWAWRPPCSWGCLGSKDPRKVLAAIRRQNPQLPPLWAQLGVTGPEWGLSEGVTRAKGRGKVMTRGFREDWGFWISRGLREGNECPVREGAY